MSHSNIHPPKHYDRFRTISVTHTELDHLHTHKLIDIPFRARSIKRYAGTRVTSERCSRLDLIAANREAAEENKHNSSTDSFESFSAVPILSSVKQKSRSVIKSASTSGLSLVIPTSDFSCRYRYGIIMCLHFASLFYLSSNTFQTMHH